MTSNTAQGTPADRMTPEQRQRARRKGRWTLVALALVFLSPTLFALLWRPEGRVNHGELVDPPFALPDATLTSGDGTPVKVAELRRKWLWAVVTDESCGPGCKESLYTLRQTRLALGKNAKRVRYGVFALGETQAEHAAIVASLPASGDDTDHPLMDVYTGVGEQAAALRKAFSELGVIGMIVLIDPLGNVVLKYPDDSASGSANEAERSVLGKKLKKDIGRLLRGSHVG